MGGWGQSVAKDNEGWALPRPARGRAPGPHIIEVKGFPKGDGGRAKAGWDFGGVPSARLGTATGKPLPYLSIARTASIIRYRNNKVVFVDRLEGDFSRDWRSGRWWGAGTGRAGGRDDGVGDAGRPGGRAWGVGCQATVGGWGVLMGWRGAAAQDRCARRVVAARPGVAGRRLLGGRGRGVDRFACCVYARLGCGELAGLPELDHLFQPGEKFGQECQNQGVNPPCRVRLCGGAQAGDCFAEWGGFFKHGCVIAHC